MFLNIVSSVRLLCDVLDETRRDPNATPLPDGLYQHAARLQAVIDLEPELTRRFGDSLSSEPRSSATTGQQQQPYEVSVRTGGLWRMLQSSRKAKNSAGVGDEEGDRTRAVLAEHTADILSLARNDAVRALLAERNTRLEHMPG